MSRAQTEEEWNREALAMLDRLGADAPEVGVDGSFSVDSGRYALLSAEQVESTDPAVEMLNQVPDPAMVQQAAEPLAAGPACNTLPCAIIRALGLTCCHTETSYNDPSIAGEVSPVRIPNATLYLNPFNARIEGDIKTSFANDSEPGEECTQRVCRCQDDGRVRCETVDGSATVDEEDSQSIVADAVDEVLDEIDQSASNVRPDAEVSREAGFRKEGALDIIESIADLLVSGTIRVETDIDTTVRYDWRGRTRTKEFSSTVEARLPVDDVDYAW